VGRAPSTSTVEHNSPLLQQAHALALILREEFGVPFTLYEAATSKPLDFADGPEAAAAAAGVEPSLIAQVAEQGQPQVASLARGQHHLLLPFRDGGATVVVAVGVVIGFARTRAEWPQEQARLVKWAQAVCERVEAVAQQRGTQRPGAAPDGQHALAWETLIALHDLLGKVRPHAAPETNQKRVLSAAAQLLGARTLAWVPQQSDAAVVLAGEPGLSTRECRQLATFLDQNSEWDRAGIVLNNQVQGNGGGAGLAGVSNLMAVRFLDPVMPGWVIALDKGERRRGKPSGGDPRAGDTGEAKTVPFRRSDAAILTPFLALMGLELRVSARMRELKDLLVGLTRSLTAAIDAKDPYTYGHSERVARVAVELGRQMGLAEEHLSDIYLAGLLHDIGKIGIRDAVLGKAAPLTPEEREHIQQHVTIGYQILADLRSISPVLPGVLYHHERYDGLGYPDGLQGEAIPLLARILAVADSYDAMSTNRPYRAGMPAPRVEEVLREGAGKQWDAQVVQAFLRGKQMIHAIRQRGLGDSLRHALDGALREPGPLPDPSIRSTNF